MLEGTERKKKHRYPTKRNKTCATLPQKDQPQKKSETRRNGSNQWWTFTVFEQDGRQRVRRGQTSLTEVVLRSEVCGNVRVVIDDDPMYALVFDEGAALKLRPVNPTYPQHQGAVLRIHTKHLDPAWVWSQINPVSALDLDLEKDMPWTTDLLQRLQREIASPPPTHPPPHRTMSRQPHTRANAAGDTRDSSF